MVVWVGIGAALAAPPGFERTKTTDACSIYVGPALANGVTPLLAECVWPDLTMPQIEPVLSRWEDHDLVFSAIEVSALVRSDGSARWVRQVHVASGITDRECVLKAQRTEVAGGGAKFSWSLDATQPAPTEGRVQVAFDDGYWQFVPRGEGGVTVTYSLAYGPGGKVPGFLVRWFQGSGFEGAISELHDYIAARG